LAAAGASISRPMVDLLSVFDLRFRKFSIRTRTAILA